MRENMPFFPRIALGTGRRTSAIRRSPDVLKIEQREPFMPITVGRLGHLQRVGQRGSDLVFSFESSDLVLTALLPNLIRHTWVPTHWRLYTEPVREAHAAVRRYWPAGPVPIVRETSKTVRIELG